MWDMFPNLIMSIQTEEAQTLATKFQISETGIYILKPEKYDSFSRVHNEPVRATKTTSLPPSNKNAA